MNKALSILLLFPLLLSCTDVDAIIQRNEELKDSVAVLKHQIEVEHSLYKFAKVRPVIIPMNPEFEVNQPNEFMIALIADEMHHQQEVNNLKIEIDSTQLESELELSNSQGIYILKYTPKEAGSDKIHVNLDFNSRFFPIEMEIDVKQTANNVYDS